MDIKQKIEIVRDNLYNRLPSGEIGAFELIKIIKNHIKELDTIILEKENETRN
jgi:hypothetical protein